MQQYSCFLEDLAEENYVKCKGKTHCEVDYSCDKFDGYIHTVRGADESSEVQKILQETKGFKLLYSPPLMTE